MFIYSLRASTLKFFAVVSVALATLITLIAFVPAYDGGNDALASKSAEYKFDGVKTAEDRVEFLAQFGWEVEKDALESVEVTIPEDFDKVFSAYNEIQKRQGLDLTKFKKKNVMRYTYAVTNYGNGESEEKVYANILVYRNRVIGGDICSANVSGFIHGFERAAG